jgi:hypothetical protein
MTAPGTIDRPPKDWAYADSDASVGIFGEGWFHDVPDCADAMLDPEETVLSRGFEGEGHNRRRHDVVEYRCPCGESMTVLDTTWDPDVPDDCDECRYDPAGWAS